MPVTLFLVGINEINIHHNYNLKVVHLNDSKGGLGEHLDRHHHIGQGYIGEKGFREILKNQSITNLPMILETPIDENTGDLDNIKKIQILHSHS